MAPNSAVVYRDAYLGSIQAKARVLDSIRFPLIITVNRSDGTTYWSAIKELLQAVYCDRGNMNIIAQSGSKLMIMFSDDQDALTAYQDLHDKTIQDHFGCVIKFKIWHPVDDLGYDIADHQIYISIEGLPLHLWKEDIVEQILHPYCALESLSEETRKRTNLESYTSFAWSQKRVVMPRKISLKVTTAHSETGVLNGRRNAKQATVYTLVIKAVGFHCDETTHCSCNLDNLNTRYEDTYDPDNAQCFLTTIPAIEDLLDELSLGVVITAVHEDHGCQKEEIQDMVSSYLGCSVKVHRLNATQFIIFSSDKDKAVVAKEVLMDTKCFHLPSTKFYVDHWKPTDNSVVEELPVKISVTITEIPAHLCTPTVAGFLLSPYCAMEDEDGHYKTTATSESFKCSAWTNAPLHLPKRIMTALFVQASEQHIVGEQHGSKDLRITQLLIDATINHVISEITGTQLTTSLKDIQDSRTQ